MKTMYPPGYHHSGYAATDALYIYIYIYIYIYPKTTNASNKKLHLRDLFALVHFSIRFPQSH